MSLIPDTGISFLWFMGVVRDRMGHHEDQFFSTLSSGSGYLYLGLTFASAASLRGILILYASDPDLTIGSDLYSLTMPSPTDSTRCTRCAWRAHS